MQNFFQYLLLASFLACCFFVLYRRRTVRYGLIVRDEQGAVLADGRQGLETTFGRSRNADVRLRDPTLSRQQAVFRYDAKSNQIIAWSKAGESGAARVVPHNSPRFSLPRVCSAAYAYGSLVPILAAGFLLLRMIGVYGEFRDLTVLLPFCILLVYLILSTAVRADHVPVAEAVMSILLTYYVDATLYLGTPVEAAVGVSLYTGCALLAYGVLCFRLHETSAVLRTVASGAALALICLNLLLASDVNGSYNWVHLGGVSFQPSEVIKVLFSFTLVNPVRVSLPKRHKILYFAVFPAICFGYALLIRDVGCLLQLGVIYLAAIVLQEDNPLISLCLIAFAIAGCKLVLLVSSTAASRYLGWRGTAETSIWAALTGAGVFQSPYHYGYQSTRATIAAFQNGGLLGNGSIDVLDSVLAANSDLVTGLLAQKHGWPLLFFLLLLYGLLLYSVMQAMGQKSKFQQTLTALSMTLMVFAMLLNTGGTFGVIALTGVVNPALSDGMSAALCYGTCFGILASSGLRRSYRVNLKGESV